MNTRSCILGTGPLAFHRVGALMLALGVLAVVYPQPVTAQHPGSEGRLPTTGSAAIATFTVNDAGDEKV